MSIDSVKTLVDALRLERLLDPDQLEELTDEVQASFDDPRALAKTLVQLGWLTIYQINHLFEGRGHDLTLGQYRVIDRLGEGGVSQVYKAWDTVRHRLVALKVLRRDLASESDAVRQFQRELQAVTRLNHPNIIKTFNADQVNNTHFFAMEFVEGTDLGKVVQLSGPLPISVACDYIRQVAAGLQHSHQMGLVHRDIKPANLYLVNGNGTEPSTPSSVTRRPEVVVKIIDWGLARLHVHEEGHPESAGASDEAGMLIGTADYIAPEQARDPRLVDIRADIYSLGCTFYYLLTGQPPFPGTSLMQKLMQHQQAEPPRIQTLRPDVPEELSAIIQKMLVKNPEGRFQIPLSIVVPLRKFCVQGGSGLVPRLSSGAVASTRPNPGGNSTMRTSITSTDLVKKS